RFESPWGHHSFPAYSAFMLSRAVLLFAFVLLLGACAYPDALYEDQMEIRDVTMSYLKDVGAGDAKDAYALLSPEIRARCPEDQFGALLDFAAGKTEAQAEPEAKVEDIDVEGRAATARLVYSNAPDDALTFQYVKQ